jgi:hypothetical protein
LANVAAAVVTAYITRGTVPAPLVPVPVSRHRPEAGQYSPLRLATVVPLGKGSAWKTATDEPRPLAAIPVMAIGPLAAMPILPTPVAMQLVFDAQANDEREVRVIPVNVSLDQTAATPALPNPPDMAIGVPALGVLVVPMATHPEPPAGHTRLVSPVMLAGMVAAVHESIPRAEMVSTKATAPEAVVPMATQFVAEGQVICDREVTPVSAVPVAAVASAGVAGLASTMMPVLTPPTRL